MDPFFEQQAIALAEIITGSMDQFLQDFKRKLTDILIETLQTECTLTLLSFHCSIIY